MSFQLFWNSPLNKDTIISILASGIILRLQADSYTYHNKHISAHTDCAQNDMIFFYYYYFKYRQSFICIPFFYYFRLQKNWVCSQFFQQICFRPGPAWWYEQPFHFLTELLSSFPPLFLLPEGEWCWNLKSKNGGSNLIQNGINHTAVATAGIECTLIYLFIFPNNRKSGA